MGWWRRWRSVALPVVVATLALLLHHLVLVPTFTTSFGIRNEPCVDAFQLFLHDKNDDNDGQQERQDAMEQTVAMLNEFYPKESASAISHHAFVHKAPLSIQKRIGQYVWNQQSLAKLATHVRLPGSPDANNNNDNATKKFHIIPDWCNSEIYWMRPEFDFVDEHKIHYDGILKLPGICTVRSLTYLSSSPSEPATLVALTSGRNFTTHVGSSIVLDFNRELHYAQLAPPPTNVTTPTTRIMIKAAVHVVPAHQHPVITFVQIAAHRVIFFTIKSVRRAFEASSSSSSSPQEGGQGVSSSIIMALDNLMRSLNKIHMALPIGMVVVPLVTILVLAPLRFPAQFVPYIVHIITVVGFDLDPYTLPMTLVTMLVVIAFLLLGINTTTTKPPISLHDDDTPNRP